MATDKNIAQHAADLARFGANLEALLYAAQLTYDQYFARAISDDVNGTANADDIVTGSPFDKGDYLAGVTLLEQFINFMQGQAVATATYRETAAKLSAVDDSSLE